MCWVLIIDISFFIILMLLFFSVFCIMVLRLFRLGLLFWVGFEVVVFRNRFLLCVCRLVGLMKLVRVSVLIFIDVVLLVIFMLMVLLLLMVIDCVFLGIWMFGCIG